MSRNDHYVKRRRARRDKWLKMNRSDRSKHERSGLVRNRRKLKKMRDERSEREIWVKDVYGQLGWDMCASKYRYDTRGAALERARRTKSETRAYRCPICGGWHITSHPIGLTHGDCEESLTLRELLEAARGAAIEIRRIEEQVELRRQRIGVQGHGYDVHGKSGILDPMRKIDELIDYQHSVFIERSDFTRTIEEAWRVMRGIATFADDLSVEIATRYYLQAEDWLEIVDANGDHPISERVEFLQGCDVDKQLSLLRRAMDVRIAEWEQVGIAKLKELGE